jgi:DNA polymerase III delta prime subunit
LANHETRSFYIGTDYDERRVSWSPEQEKNPHLVVVGESGTGKTQTLKALIEESKSWGVGHVILDYHDEYRDISTKSVDIRYGISINPLELSGKPEVDTAYEIAGIFRRLGLVGGDQQEAIFRKAILRAYGIDSDRSMRPIPNLAPSSTPTFKEVKRCLNQLEATDSHAKRVVPALLNRLGVIFDLGLFSKPTTIPFDDLVRGTSTISLKTLPTEETRFVVADFFLRKLWDYVYRWDKTNDLRVFCILDEAHRLAYPKSPVDRMLREARKYGVGMVLASQSPHDFDPIVLANAATRISFRCHEDSDAQFMAQQLGCQPGLLASLSQAGEAVVSLGSVDGFDRVRVVSHDNRKKGSPDEKPSAPPTREKEAEDVSKTDSKKLGFVGQVSFGKGGKMKGTASLKNWK